MISFNSRPIWRSRKPIGKYAICDGPHTGASASNPKGWFFNPAIVMGGDETDFRAAANAYADGSIDVLDSIHAQAAVFWQLEGGAPDTPFYLGDPTKLFDLSPEWLAGMTNPRTLEGSVIHEFLGRFTSAGYKLGCTLRPHDFNFGTLLWETSNNPTHTLWRKARYAYDRLGMRIFYVDSNVTEPNSGPVLPAIVFEKLRRLLPDCLFVPEHEEGGYYAVCAPFGDSSDGFMPTPAYIRDYYPHAFRFVNFGGCTLEQYEALINSPTGRDILTVDAWYSNTWTNMIVTGLGDGGTDGG